MAKNRFFLSLSSVIARLPKAAEAIPKNAIAQPVPSAAKESRFARLRVYFGFASQPLSLLAMTTLLWFLVTPVYAAVKAWTGMLR